jgi:ABC-type polar amino acid transport system ATPase subunit
LIKVEDLAKHYGNGPVLDGVSFEVHAGETAAILGPSGAGKSTLLRCLVGLEGFDRGSITVADACVRGLDRVAQKAQLAEQVALRGRVGLVFQSFELFPHMTVLDNCTLAPMRVLKKGRDQALDFAQKLLGQLGLGDKAAAYPDHLSGGQRQRVAIARALAMEPRVLLYDEPTSALDPSLKMEVRDTIQAVGRTGVTQVVVTHDLALASDLGRIFHLERGRIEHGRTTNGAH